MSDLISRAELFNRLATVKDMGEAYAVIQGMPTVVAFEFDKWYDFKRGYVLETNMDAFRILRDIGITHKYER